MKDLIDRAGPGKPVALSRLLTVVERDGEGRRSVAAALRGRRRVGHVVGITGPPGAGKSSLIGALLGDFATSAGPVAVLSVDSSSRRSGGALLGDRLRMGRVEATVGAFVRSMGSRGEAGGLSRAAATAVDVLASVGFGTVIVETVGAGQGELAIADIADTVVVVSVPGLGDVVQADKAGILEIADVHAVHKADVDGAERLAAQLRGRDGEADGWKVPVVLTSIADSIGVTALTAAVAAHAAHLGEDGRLGARRRAALHRRLVAAVNDEVLDRLGRADWSAADRLAWDVCDGRSDAEAAAQQLLEEALGQLLALR